MNRFSPLSCLLAAGLAFPCISPAQQRTPKIVGGQPAAAGEFGYIAALLTHGISDAMNAQTCGGTLIHPYWVVTAGHCVEGEYPDTMDVLLGTGSLTNTSGAKRIRVAEIILYPQYDSETLDNDIALLLLAEPAPSSLPLLPLIDDPALAEPETLAVSAGWGTTSEDGDFPTVLHKVSLPVLATELVNLPDWLDGEVTENMLAAGYLAGGKDTCQGDSGGPLIVPGPGGIGSRLAGIVSWGDGCGQVRRPGVFTRVSRFRQWAQQYIYPGFTAWERAAGIQSEDPPDLDGDGLPQWAEYALKLPPGLKPATAAPALSFVREAGISYPALTFRRRTDAADFTLNPGVSRDLVSWAAVDPALNQTGPPVPVPVPGETGVELLTVRSGLAAEPEERQFFRLEAGPSRQIQRLRRAVALNSVFEARLNTFDPLSESRHFREYLLTGLTPGQAAPVSVESTDFFPAVRVLEAASGNVAATGVLSGRVSSLNFVPAADNSYVIQVSSTTAGATGYFGLTAGVIGSGGTPLPVPSALTTGALTVSDPPDPDFLPEIRYYDVWQLTGTQAGQPVTITASSAVLDTYLYLYEAATGTFLEENDDISNANINSRITFTPLPGRTYEVWVSTAVQNQTGGYQIQATP